MGCGMFITSQADVLSECFRVSTSYMPSNNAGLDPYVTTRQWSRRFVGLRLFLSLATAGWGGYAAHVERAIQLAEFLAAELEKSGWTVINRSSLAVVCAVPPAGSPAPGVIARQVVASGVAWVSSAIFRDREVVRMCVTNGQSTRSDIETLVATMRSLVNASDAEWLGRP